MSPFEALYGRKCNTLVRWDNAIDRALVGPYLLREMEEEMLKIKQNQRFPKTGRKSMRITEEIIGSMHS
jgi:hypothetical protein